jgi:FAD/FMN-containing dehydrogenase
LRRRRIHIQRRAGKIGFMGKGLSVPSHEKSEVAHALSLRIDEDMILVSDAHRDRCREDAVIKPGILRRFFSKKPEVVVRPDSGQCVAEILDVCIEEKTPAVPRGLGTAGLGGAMPVRGGVVIDLTRLCKIVDVDKAGERATVESGCTWATLQEEVNKEGLSLRSYPSSAAHSTVGGWVSTGGYGVGTLTEGSFHRQVEEMEVAVPSGLLVSAGHDQGRYSIRSLAGTEGQLGVVTRLTLPLKAKPEGRVCYLVHLLKEEDGPSILQAISAMDGTPHMVKMASRMQAQVLEEIWGLPGRDKPFIIVAGEGSSQHTGRLEAAIKKLAFKEGLEVEEPESSSSLWSTHFSHMGKYKDMTLFLAGEVLIEAERLSHFLRLLEREAAEGRHLLYECQLVEKGKVLVWVTYRGKSRDDTELLRDVPLTAKIVTIACKSGGIPYGLGMWNSHHSRLVFGEYYKILKVIKSETDRLKILNPGKFFEMITNTGVPVSLWLYGIGMRLAGGT